MKQKNVAGIFLIRKKYILHLRFVMKAIFEFGLLPSEKYRKNLSGNEIGCSVNSEKC